MPPIAFARRFAAIALGESLHDPKCGVRREFPAPLRGCSGSGGNGNREGSPCPICVVRLGDELQSSSPQDTFREGRPTVGGSTPRW